MRDWVHRYNEEGVLGVINRGGGGAKPRLTRLRVWCQQAERDGGQRGGLTTAEKNRIKDLGRENKELCQANEILKKRSAYFAQAELDRPYKRLASLKITE